MTALNKHMQESESKCASKQCLPNSSRNSSLSPGWYQDGSFNFGDVQGEISRHWSRKEEAKVCSKHCLLHTFIHDRSHLLFLLHRSFGIWLQTSILRRRSFPSLSTHGVHLESISSIVFHHRCRPGWLFPLRDIFSMGHPSPHGAIPSCAHHKQVMFDLSPFPKWCSGRRNRLSSRRHGELLEAAWSCNHMWKPQWLQLLVKMDCGFAMMSGSTRKERHYRALPAACTLEPSAAWDFLGSASTKITNTK